MGNNYCNCLNKKQDPGNLDVAKSIEESKEKPSVREKLALTPEKVAFYTSHKKEIIKIQAHYKGYNTRKKYRVSPKPSKLIYLSYRGKKT